jgi:hypothetical protein
MVKSEETFPICHVHKNIEFLCVKNISGLGERHSSLPPKQSHQTKSQEFPEHFHSLEGYGELFSGITPSDRQLFILQHL